MASKTTYAVRCMQGQWIIGLLANMSSLLDGVESDLRGAVEAALDVGVHCAVLEAG